MSNFTNGPWVADKTSRAIGPVSKDDDQSYGMVIPVAWVEFDPEVEIQAANANLIAAAPELLEALQWALPLAKIAMDSHRMARVECGHSDITGTYKDGVTWVGIYQEEVDAIESAQAAIIKALGQ